MNEQLLRERFHEVWAELPVGPAPVAAVVGARKRRTRVVVGVAAAGAAAVLAVVLLAPDEARETAPAVEPRGPVWWADDTLHVGAETVAAPGVETLVVVGERVVVYADEDGAVVQVTPDGDTEVIGHAVPGAPIAGNATSPWVAWVDPNDRHPLLYVRDVVTGETVERHGLTYRGPRWGRLDAGSYPIAVDGPSVYVAAQEGDLAVVPGAPQLLAQYTDGDDDFIVDHAGGNGLLFHPDGDTVTLARRSGPDDTFAGGEDASLSDDGRFYLPGGSRWQPRRTDDGAAVSVGVADLVATFDDGAIVRAEFSGDDEITYVIGSDYVEPDSSGGGFIGLGYYRTFTLATCELGSGRCAVVGPGASSEVVLPG